MNLIFLGQAPGFLGSLSQALPSLGENCACILLLEGIKKSKTKPTVENFREEVSAPNPTGRVGGGQEDNRMSPGEDRSCGVTRLRQSLQQGMGSC